MTIYKYKPGINCIVVVTDSDSLLRLQKFGQKRDNIYKL